MIEERIYVQLYSKVKIMKNKFYLTRRIDKREISREEVDKLMEELKYDDSDVVKKQISNQHGCSEDPDEVSIIIYQIIENGSEYFEKEIYTYIDYIPNLF